MSIDIVSALVAFITLVITVPSTMFAVREYRGRPRLEPRLYMGSQSRASVINVGRYPASNVNIEFRISNSRGILWTCSRTIDFLDPGVEVNCDSTGLQLLRADVIGADAVLEFYSERARVFSILRPSIKRRTWSILDPDVSRLT